MYKSNIVKQKHSKSKCIWNAIRLATFAIQLLFITPHNMQLLFNKANTTCT